MKGTFFLFLCLALVCGGGCAAASSVADWIFGTTESGEDKAGDSPAETAAPFLNLFLPGLGTALVGVGGVYAEVRRRKWAKALHATAEVVEEFAGVNPNLKPRLAKVHGEYGVQGIMQGVVARFGHREKAVT